MAKTIEALNRAAGFLRGRLSKEIDMRYTPQVRFVSDESDATEGRATKSARAARMRMEIRSSWGGRIARRAAAIPAFRPIDSPAADPHKARRELWDFP